MTVTARPGARIVAFAAGLAVVFGAAFGIGAAVGPWDDDPAPSHGPSIQHDPASMNQEGMH